MGPARQCVSKNAEQARSGQDRTKQDHDFRPETGGQLAGEIRPGNEEGDPGHLHDDEVAEIAAQTLGDHGGGAEHEDQQPAQREGLAQRVAQEGRGDEVAQIAARRARRRRRRHPVAQQSDQRRDAEAQHAEDEERAFPAEGHQQPDAQHGGEGRDQGFDAGHEAERADGFLLGEHRPDHARRENSCGRTGQALRKPQAHQGGQGRRRHAGKGHQCISREGQNQQVALVYPCAKFSEHEKADTPARHKGGKHHLGHRLRAPEGVRQGRNGRQDQICPGKTENGPEDKQAKGEQGRGGAAFRHSSIISVRGARLCRKWPGMSSGAC